MKSPDTIQDLRQKIALIEQRVPSPKKGMNTGSSSGFIESGNDAELHECNCSYKRYRGINNKHTNPSTFNDALNENAAFQKILRAVVRREYSAKGMLKKLLESGYSADVADVAVQRAVACGLIDDNRFSEVLVRSRLSQGKGKCGILHELEQNGIYSRDAEVILLLFDDVDSEYERAQTALNKKSFSSKNKRNSAYQYLIRKGFSSDVAITVAKSSYPYNN